jgi:DNA-binding response OmpR family regulator
MKIKVLVIEDNQLLNKSLVAMLKRENYIAYGATDVETGKQLFLEKTPHIILLDIMLPNEMGYNIIPYFRSYNDCVIMMITALGDKESKQISYENGADDYITKPFDLEELVYKLGAVKRRLTNQIKVFYIGDISFEMDTNKLCCHKKSFIIQPSQIKLLKGLYDKYMENTYLDKRVIFQEAAEDINESSRIQTLVARLRKNLIEVGSRELVIETLYGKGYQLSICKKENENGEGRY